MGEQQVVFYWVTGKWQVVFYWVTGQPDNIHDTELCRNYIESATLSRHTLRSIEDSNAKQTLQWRLVIKVLYCTVFVTNEWRGLGDQIPNVPWKELGNHS